MGTPRLRPEADIATAGASAAPLTRVAWRSFRRMLRYGCVGVAISLLYSLAVIACMQAPQLMTPTTASVLAFIVTLPVAYLAHRRITFSDRPYDTRQPLRFAFSTSTSFIVAVGGMYLITEVAGRNYLFGIAWNWLIIPVTNFLTYMFWVFRGARTKGKAA
jgi:putative flippase GtrA